MTTKATRLPQAFSATTAALKEAIGETWLYLPFPSSVNRNYRAVKGRVILSEKYRAWKKQAMLELQAQKAPRLIGKVRVRVTLRAPDKRRRDADNSLKSLMDCLKDYGVISDDSNQIVRSIAVEWDDGAGHPCVINLTRA